MFLYGDPRFLAGSCGLIDDSNESYEFAPETFDASHCLSTLRVDGVTSVFSPEGRSATLPEIVRNCDNVYSGRYAYHHTPTLNNFMITGQYPTVGIELETVDGTYDRDHVDHMIKELKSNWFHFERDGSVDRAHDCEFGFEVITVPLPPRLYRDPRLWVGLENVLSPWLESFDHSCTGLHVHVGVKQFEDAHVIPISHPNSRRMIGKMMATMIYLGLIPSSFIDRVCLRPNNSYCAAPADSLVARLAPLKEGKLIGHNLIDMALEYLMFSRNYEQLQEVRHLSYNGIGCCQPAVGATVPHIFDSHDSELNLAHNYTLEFRRGKGTLHALSIHRMIELMSLIVRYAMRCCNHPDENITTKAFFDYALTNTTSEPLKKLILKEVY